MRLHRSLRSAAPLPGPLRAVRWTSGRARLLAAICGAVVPVGLVGCGNATQPELLQLRLSPEAGLVVGVGSTTIFEAIARGANGVTLDAGGASWSIDDPRIASVDGGRVTGLAVGETGLSVSLGGLVASGTVEVYEPPVVADYEAGVSYWGRQDYVEYIPGTLPVVLSAPHGGAVLPQEIPDRTSGTLVTDRNTIELSLAIRDAFLDATGHAPHLVISHLDRAKLDPNREVVEAAQGNPFAEHAWEEYHRFIEEARETVAAFGGGMYFDLHGHGHPEPRLELGYLLTSSQLNQPDASLNSLAVVMMTSIREIGRDSPIPFSQLIRGPTSFGALLESEGVPAIPSPTYPMPGSDPYFSGGYSTWRHGSIADTELVSGIQIEHHFPGLRDSDANRQAYAVQLAAAVRAFMLEHFGFFEP